MARYGNYGQSGSVFILTDDNTQSANVFNRMTEDGWLTKLGFYGGKGGTANATARLAVWDTDDAMNPTTLVRQSNAFSVTLPAQAVNSPTYEVSVTPAQLWNNKRYALGPATNQRLQIVSTLPLNVNGDNKSVYYRSGTSVPTNPFGHTSVKAIGWAMVWAEYQPNRGPTAIPSTPQGEQLTTTPTFVGTFSDPDAAYGDKIKAFRIVVQRSSDNATMWDTGAVQATSAEAAAAQFSRLYTGSTLAGGVDYKWMCQVQDQFNRWSPWSAYKTFTVSASGVIDTLGVPTGRQTTRQPSLFSATWRNASGLGMNAVRVRIKSGGTVIRQSGDIPKVIGNNTPFTVGWAEAFGSYQLSWGLSNLTWEMQGQNSIGVWGTWSAGQSFYTNAAPAIPTNLSPSNSLASTTRPVLRLSMPDDQGDSLTIKARIKNSAGTVLFTRTMGYVGFSNGMHQYQYQTTSTDLASYGTYRWDAYSYDGHLYSGEQTSEANAAKSAEAVFVYALGPVVTLLSPENGAVISGDVNIDWADIPNQKSYVVRFYDANNNLWKQTGTVTSAASGTGIDNFSWGFRNNATYKFQVEVTDTNNLVGTSYLNTFTIAYDEPPAVTNFVASPEYLRLDSLPSAIRLTWTQVELPTDPENVVGFSEYVITRRETGQNEQDALVLARIPSISTTAFIDYVPASGVDYTYTIYQVQLRNLDSIVSPPTEAQVAIEVENVILQDVRNADNRAILMFDTDRGFDHIDDLELELTWGADAPSGVYGTVQYQTFSGTFKIASDNFGTAREHINALRQLWRARTTLCFRDERGRRFFGKITSFSEQDSRIQNYEVDLQITQVAFSEGVVS